MVVIDDDFLYRLKGDKLILNFLGRDVLAVREDNQVFLSAGDIEIAVLVLVAQIAGHQPAVLGERLGGFFGILVVALHLPYTILELNEVYTGEPAGMSDMRLIVNNDLIGLGYGKFGTDKGIPQMILAGASCDDIFVIVLFSTFVTMAQGGSVKATDFLNIPTSIVLGVLLGASVGLAVFFLFEKAYQYNYKIRNSTKVIILLGTSFLLMGIETLVKPYVAMSGLLAVVAMACIVKMKADKCVSAQMSKKFGKLWIGAEVMLFVLVGAAVDIRYTLTAGGMAVLMIFIALAFRTVGVCLCMLGTELTTKERLFCVIAYLPKATVQAAIGSVPLSLGLPCGKIILSVAVLAILITAPLGAIGIDRTHKKLIGGENS